MRSVFCFDLHFLRGAASVKRGTAGALKELTILCLAAVLALPACSRISSSDGVQANSALPSAEQAAVAVPIIPIAEVVRNIEGGCVTKGEAVPEGSMQIGLRKHEDMPVIAKLVRETQTEGTPFAAKIKELVGVTIGDPYTIISTDRLQETRVVRFEWNELWEVLTVVVQPAKEPADDVLLYRGAALPAAVRLHKVVNLAADPAYQDAMRKVVEYVTANTPLKHRKGLNWLGVDVDDITYIRGNFGGGIHGHVIVNASENRQTGFSPEFPT